MRLHVVSDVHGNVAALARAAAGADGLVVLGDLLEWVDYRDPRRGVLGRVLGPEVSDEFRRLRAAGDRASMIALVDGAWARFEDPYAVVRDEIGGLYAETFGVLGGLDVPVWAIPGNVDSPELWPDTAGVQAVDGTVQTIDGVRVGFLGGVPLPPGIEPRRLGPWRPHFLTAGDYAEALSALGPTDVLCSHAPPAVPELTYDVVARRSEGGSPALRARIAADRPWRALFGHVHQPLAPRARVGATECVNVGHFRATERPYVLRW